MLWFNVLFIIVLTLIKQRFIVVLTNVNTPTLFLKGC
nr:MAG TPA: hypothetical protein [Caudoviricetes sp.]